MLKTNDRLKKQSEKQTGGRQGVETRVQGTGYRVQGTGHRVQGREKPAGWGAVKKSVGGPRSDGVTTMMIPTKIIKSINYLFFVAFFRRAFNPLNQKGLAAMTSILRAFLQGIRGLLGVNPLNRSDFEAIWPRFSTTLVFTFGVPDGTISGSSRQTRRQSAKYYFCRFREIMKNEVGVSRAFQQPGGRRDWHVSGASGQGVSLPGGGG
jgi:hypothetical protein